MSNKIRNKKQLKKKALEWAEIPTMVTGAYRLFAYLDWDMIPKLYQDMYKPEAKEAMQTPTVIEDARELDFDINVTIKSIMQNLVKSRVVGAFSLFPILLADNYVLGGKVAKPQGELHRIINEYKEISEINLYSAQIIATGALRLLMLDICKDLGVQLDFDIDGLTLEAIESIEKRKVKPEPEKEIDEEKLKDSIGKAIEEYESKEEEVDEHL